MPKTADGVDIKSGMVVYVHGYPSVVDEIYWDRVMFREQNEEGWDGARLDVVYSEPRLDWQLVDFELCARFRGILYKVLTHPNEIHLSDQHQVYARTWIKRRVTLHETVDKYEEIWRSETGPLDLVLKEAERHAFEFDPKTLTRPTTSKFQFGKITRGDKKVVAEGGRWRLEGTEVVGSLIDVLTASYIT